MKPKVSIIIVTWNSRRHLPKCLECITNQTCKDYEMIVVDNASDDGSLEFLNQNYPHLTIIKNKKNLGFAKANNQGIKASHGEFILILNPDVFPEPEFLEALVTCLSHHNHYGSVGGKLFLCKDGEKSRIIDSTGLFLGKSFKAIDRGNLKEDRGQYDQEESIFAACGAAALLRKETLERVKLGEEYFDEDFFAYYEDLDLGWRIQLSGYECGYVPKAVAYHVRGGSGIGTKFFKKGKTWQRLTLRNRYQMLIKNLSLINLLFFFPFFLLTEFILLLYILFQAPHLFIVYGDISRNFRKLLKKRSLIQLSRIKGSGYIRHWIMRAP